MSEVITVLNQYPTVILFFKCITERRCKKQMLNENSKRLTLCFTALSNIRMDYHRTNVALQCICAPCKPII